MKDPAFLFYSKDFLTGVSDLTNEEVGQYIKLLCIQHQKGHLTERAMNVAVGTVSEFVLAKFEKDEHGLYYNERLEIEAAKRANYTKGRRDNLKGGKAHHKDGHMETHMGEHMKAHMVNVNVDVDVDADVTETVNSSEIDQGFIEKVREIIGYLNSRVGANYRATSKATQRHISARLNEGFAVNEFKVVIDKKADEWTGTEWEKFIRPETLFGTKFEGYLNQPRKAKQSSTGNKYTDMLSALQGADTS
jgi:uncharacterized phage protein (TIGR02220 family)